MSFRWWRYTLPSKSAVFLTVRPDAYRASAAAWVGKAGPSVRFSFTDDLVEFPGMEHHWYPWIPLKNLPVELVWGFLCTFSAIESKGPTRLWLHCDSSSMRAPTFFGLYLLARWPNQAKEICDRCETNAPATLLSRPDEYAALSIQQDPGVSDLVKAWNEGGMSAAHRKILTS